MVAQTEAPRRPLGSPPHRPQRRRGRSRTTLILLVITSVVLITADFRATGGPLRAARDITLDVLGPVRSVGERVFGPVGDAWNGAFSYGDLEAENNRLRAELAELRGQALGAAELRERVIELESLLELDQDDPLDRVVADVIDAPLSNFERTIELDKGSDDGIREGMPVDTGAGLIGRIIQVAPGRSRVQLVTDPNFDVGVRLVSSADEGVASGRGRDEPLVVRFIEATTVVIPGETVLTSGLEGSVYPPGIVVGTVVSSTVDPISQRQEVLVAPAPDLERIRVVSVILWDPEPERQDQAPFG